MKIQIVNYAGRFDLKTEAKTELKMEISGLSRPQSFDAYDIDIILLNDKNIWQNRGNNTDRVKAQNDFISINKIIENCTSAQVIVVLPQNIKFLYNFWNEEPLASCVLKDMIEELRLILKALSSRLQWHDLFYERTKTNFENHMIEADFYFNGVDAKNILTKSDRSKKATTIRDGKLIFTTLNLETEKDIQAFLQGIGLIESKKSIPEWIEEIKMFDDEKQLELINENSALIEQYKRSIDEAEIVLARNNRYKSILYTQSDELVEVVFEMLQEMTGGDLSNFVDQKHEDFLFEAMGYVFIGEIKGVNHNIRSENVSQLDVHYQSYIDDYPENLDKTKALLIMNYQRNKPLLERDEIHETQINLAKRNGSLIIDTFTLLKMFEQFKQGSLDQRDCVRLLSESTGILSIS